MTEYAIEFHQDAPRDGYGKVHVAGCKDLRDPEPLGTDWQSGIRALGTEWEMDLDDGSIRTASCVKPAKPDEKWFVGQEVSTTDVYRTRPEVKGIVEAVGRTLVHVRVQGAVEKFRKDSGFPSSTSAYSRLMTDEDIAQEGRLADVVARLGDLGFEAKRGANDFRATFTRPVHELESIANFIAEL